FGVLVEPLRCRFSASALSVMEIQPGVASSAPVVVVHKLHSLLWIFNRSEHPTWEPRRGPMSVTVDEISGSFAKTNHATPEGLNLTSTSENAFGNCPQSSREKTFFFW